MAYKCAWWICWFLFCGALSWAGHKAFSAEFIVLLTFGALLSVLREWGWSK